MIPNPTIFVARKSGVPITPAVIAAMTIAGVAVVLLQDLSIMATAAFALAVLLYFGFWGTKPTLKSEVNSLEYRNGKILTTVKRSDISDAVIRGNRFVGRSLVISGNVFVTVDDGKHVQSRSLVIPDVF